MEATMETTIVGFRVSVGFKRNGIEMETRNGLYSDY